MVSITKIGMYLCVLSVMLSCQSVQTEKILAEKPPMGWNSFMSYGVYLHEQAAMENLEAMAEKLKSYGYEYYVIDNGWFGEYVLQPGTMYPAEKHASDVRINEYGLLQPSECYFPNGMQPIIDRCHELGLKFGVHLMRGIPRKAVKQNLPIQGTPYHAQDIADINSICAWCDYNYGVDMSKPGAQEFYNSLVNQLASWGVDFIKADDIVPFPEEVVAMAKAIEQCGRPIMLSLSPGGNAPIENIASYRYGNMLRVTADIWDDKHGIDQCFDAWKKWQGTEQSGFYPDMDMIPFGQLQLMSPKPANLGNRSKADLQAQAKAGTLEDDIALLAGKGWHRQCEFTEPQMLSFITLRALSASPLMMGGDLPSLDDYSLSLLTNADMLACNQNSVMGHLAYESGGIEVWNTPEQGAVNAGWLGVFNRTDSPQSVSLTPEQLGLDAKQTYKMRDVWNIHTISASTDYKIPADGVVFIRYE
jgi:alpha-galactosidase